MTTQREREIKKTGIEVLELELALEVKGAGCRANPWAQARDLEKIWIGPENVHLQSSLQVNHGCSCKKNI